MLFYCLIIVYRICLFTLTETSCISHEAMRFVNSCLNAIGTNLQSSCVIDFIGKHKGPNMCLRLIQKHNVVPCQKINVLPRLRMTRNLYKRIFS